MFYMYILISKSGKRTYTGHTANLEKRFQEHNCGEVKSLRNWRPYEILFFESFETIKEAKAQEIFYKSSLGRYRLKKLVTQWKVMRAAK